MRTAGAILCLLLSGCVFADYHDGQRHATYIAFVIDTKASKLMLDFRGPTTGPATRANMDRVYVNGYDGAVNDQAVEAIAKGATEAAIEAMKRP
jgi:hypothetical protein